jgi:hypothetical protein
MKRTKSNSTQKNVNGKRFSLEPKHHKNEKRCETILLLSLSKFALVELEFGTFENVAIATARLTRAAGNHGEKTALAELFLKARVERADFLALGDSFLDVFGTFLGGGVNGSFGHIDGVKLFIPLSEGRGIDEDDGAFDESLGTDKFVVGSIVDNIEHTSLAGAGFGGPRKVARIQGEGAVFVVATTNTDRADNLLVEFGVGRRAGEFGLALLLVDLAAATGQAAFVSRVTADTHDSKKGLQAQKKVTAASGGGGKKERKKWRPTVIKMKSKTNAKPEQRPTKSGSK